MKVLLIKPPHWGYYHEIDCRHVPIGLAYLAAACRKQGHEVGIFDALSFTEDNRVLDYDELTEPQKKKVDTHPSWKHIIHWGASWERMNKYICTFNPDVVGISIIHSPFYETAYRASDLVRSILPHIPIVAGGSHATIAYEHVLIESSINYVVLGEGEITFPKLLSCIEKGEKPYELEGVCFREPDNLHADSKSCDGIQIYASPNKIWIEDLDDLGFPAVDLLDFNRYEGYTTLITSRGCPFSCNFCSGHFTMGKQYRVRSPENVIAEIERYIDSFKVRKFNIEDENFTFDINRAEKILDMIIERNLDIEIRFPDGITPVNMTKQFVDKMAKAGTTYLFIGLETTFKEHLKKISKPFTSLNKVSTILKWFYAHGVKAEPSLIMGLPDQTLDEMIQDVIAMIWHNIQFEPPNPYYPVPKTPLYDYCLDRGYISEDMDLSWIEEFNFPIETENFTRKDLCDLWEAWLALTIWPCSVEHIKQKFGDVNQMAAIINNENKGGDINIVREDFYFVPAPGDSFSEWMKINPESENAETFVDDLTGTLIAKLSYMFTGQPYKATQVDSILAGGSQNLYFVIPDDSMRSRAVDLFIKSLHEVYEHGCMKSF